MDNNQIYVKPAKKGQVVRLEGKPGESLSEDGDTVERSTYWVRRLQDGSVVEAKPPKTAASTTSSTAKE